MDRLSSGEEGALDMPMAVRPCGLAWPIAGGASCSSSGQWPWAPLLDGRSRADACSTASQLGANTRLQASEVLQLMPHE